MDIVLKKARTKDSKLIHEMQVMAFSELLKKYKDYETNPAAESLQSIEIKMAQTFTTYYIAFLENMHIGVIRVVRLNDNIYRISPMFVLPEYQGNGYSQQIIKHVESIYPHAKRWELDTIKQEDKLCYLYEKMGYIASGKEEDIFEGMTITHYEKPINLY